MLSAPAPITFEPVARACVGCGVTIRGAERAVRWAMIDAALAECRGNQCSAARKLGIHRNTLARDIAEMRAAKRTVNTSRKRGGSVPGWHYHQPFGRGSAHTAGRL